MCPQVHHLEKVVDRNDEPTHTSCYCRHCIQRHLEPLSLAVERTPPDGISSWQPRSFIRLLQRRHDAQYKHFGIPQCYASRWEEVIYPTVNLAGFAHLSVSEVPRNSMLELVLTRSLLYRWSGARRLDVWFAWCFGSHTLILVYFGVCLLSSRPVMKSVHCSSPSASKWHEHRFLAWKMGGETGKK